MIYKSFNYALGTLHPIVFLEYFNIHTNAICTP